MGMEWKQGLYGRLWDAKLRFGDPMLQDYYRGIMGLSRGFNVLPKSRSLKVAAEIAHALEVECLGSRAEASAVEGGGLLDGC